MKLRDIRVTYGKYLNIKIGEAAIPPYITIGVLIAVVIVAYLRSVSS